jgi:hypothetical protein
LDTPFTTLTNITRSLRLGINTLLILGLTTTAINNSQSLFDNNNSFMVYAQELVGIPSDGFSMAPPQQPQQPGEYAGGTIASIQNDKNGIPTWLLSGAWNGAIINMEKEESKANTIPSNSINTNTDDNNLPTAVFEANFDMVLLNGSALHKHNIYNFTVTDITKVDDKNYQINGTATVTMKDGPVNNVPLSIKAMNNNVISILVDPSKISNLPRFIPSLGLSHFGYTPIYGLIDQDIVIKK